MDSRTIVLTLCFAAAACSGLDPLTEDRLDDAEQRWFSNAPDGYRVVLEVSGERVNAGRFEVWVRGDDVLKITLDGEPIAPERAEDYSIAGLFGILRQELALAEDPQVLGAPEGYAVHLLARFHPETGRLEQYRRSVGGTSNNVRIEVVEFEPETSQPRP